MSKQRGVIDTSRFMNYNVIMWSRCDNLKKKEGIIMGWTSLSIGLKLESYETPQQMASGADLNDIAQWAAITTDERYERDVVVDRDVPRSLGAANLGPIGLIMWGVAFVVGVVASSWGLFFGIFFIGCIPLFIGIVAGNHVENDQDREKIKRKHQRKMVATGKMAAEALPLAFDQYINKFPTMKFYEQCAEAKVLKLETDFERKKAEAIFVDMIKPITDKSPIFNALNARMNRLFEKGKAEKNACDKREFLRKQAWDAVPHKGNPSIKEQDILKDDAKCKPLVGIEKRKHLLKVAHSRTKIDIELKKMDQENLRKFGGIIANSVSETKPMDWALLGGIANGLAGPGAGMSVALGAMAENAKIEAENQRKREGAFQIFRGIQNGQLAIYGEISDLQDALKILDSEIAETEKKASLSEVTAETFETEFKIVKKSIEKTDTNLLKVSVDLMNGFTPDVPDGVRVVADGTISAQIYVGKTYVGEAIIPLPLYGIECGKTETITGYCPMYMEGDRHYTIQIEKNNLWLVEL